MNKTRNNDMKRILTSITLLLFCTVWLSAQNYTLRIRGGLSNQAVKQRIENRVSALLTELREKGIEAPYLRCRRIIGLILGASIVLGGVLPLLALVFIAVLACNRHYLGRFTPKKWF